MRERSRRRIELARDDLLLLRAALSPSREARQAWDEMAPRFHLDGLDGDRYRLVPLVGWNLEQAGEHGADDPLLARMVGITRRTWLQAHRHEQVARDTTAVLASAGVESVVIKGVALASYAYPRLGLRPMEDVDLLVRPRDAREAVTALTRAGWRSKGSPSAVHARALVGPEGDEVDVHLHPGPLLVRPDDDPAITQMWDHRVTLDGDEGVTSTRGQLATNNTRTAPSIVDAAVATVHRPQLFTLSPTDQLLVVVSHGVASPRSTPIRWIADATWLIRSQQIDWPYFVDQAGSLRCAASLGLGVATMHALGFGPVPSWVVSSIGRLRRSAADRFILESLRHRRVPSAARVFVQLCQADSKHDRLSMAPRRAAEALHLGSIRELPSEAVSRGYAYIRRVGSS